MSVSVRERLIVDVADRDQPVVASSTDIAWNADRILRDGDYLMQIEQGYSWDVPSPGAIRISRVDEPDTVVAELGLSEGAIIGTEKREGLLHVLSSLVETKSEKDPDGGNISRSERTLISSIIDVANPTSPKLLGETRTVAGTDEEGQRVHNGELLYEKLSA